MADVNLEEGAFDRYVDGLIDGRAPFGGEFDANIRQAVEGYQTAIGRLNAAHADACRELAEARAEANDLEADRNRWIRLFNRLDAAISHHKRDNQFADLEDEALWSARARVLRDAAQKEAPGA